MSINACFRVHIGIFFKLTATKEGNGSYGLLYHDDVTKWKHFPRYWPFVRGIHQSPVNSPHKDQWRGTLMFSLICTSTYCWANHRDVAELWRHGPHYDVIVMPHAICSFWLPQNLSQANTNVLQFFAMISWNPDDFMAIRCRPIIWPYDDLLSIGSTWTNFHETLNK